MPKNSNLFAAVLLAALCSLSVVGQAATGKIVHSKFVSLDGSFTIDLPNKTDDRIEPVGSMSNGASTFVWHSEDANFTVGFVDGISAPVRDRFAALDELADSAVVTHRDSGSRIIERCPFSFNGYPGIELRVERSNGVKAINRFILVGRRLYILTTDWPAAGDEARQRRVLDSFELLDTRSLVA